MAAEDWREYAGSEDFLAPLRQPPACGLESTPRTAIAAAEQDPSWRSLAALDAGVRMLESLARFGRHRARAPNAPACSKTFSSTPTPSRNIIGRFGPARKTASLSCAARCWCARSGVAQCATSRRLHRNCWPRCNNRAARPGRELLRLLGADGVFTPAAIAICTRAGERRGDRGSDSVPWLARRWARRSDRPVAAGRDPRVAFSLALLLLEIPLAGSLLRFGRRLEIRLRLAFLEKIPRLGDRYFQSRLKSDMAERSHSIHLIRRLPELGGQLLRYSFEIVFTTAGIIWLDPASAPIAILAAFAALAIPLASQPLLMERDLRLRTHAGALTHFYLDALLGLVAIRTHGGQPAVRREHESLLTEWARAGLNLAARGAFARDAPVSRRLRSRDLAAGFASGARRPMRARCCCWSIGR